MSNLKFSTDLPGVVKDTNLVIEAIVENIDVKHKLFKSIDSVSIHSILGDLEYERVSQFYSLFAGGSQ